MQDFLKDRPVLSAEEVRAITSSPSVGASGAASPFARIVRSEPASARSAPPAGVGKAPAPASPAAAHTSQVRTVVENGRIARLIVTCSCGKVTEIACAY